MKTRVLISEDKLLERFKELGKQLTEEYKGKRLLVVSVLRGGFMFTSDLVKQMDGEFEIEFMQASSYGHGKETSGCLEIRKGIDKNIEEYDVLVVDDIADSGISMSQIVEYLKKKNPKSIKTCTMLDKKMKRKVNFDVDYIGFDIEDCFVVGYGLDYKGYYRNVPYIFEVIEE